SGTVGAAAGVFTVKVADASGKGVAGVTVNFSTTGSATATPLTAQTDAAGLASTQVALGTIAGTGVVRATAVGIASPVSTSITVQAGPAAKIVVTPKTLRFLAVGDTARVPVSAQDQFGNAS